MELQSDKTLIGKKKTEQKVFRREFKCLDTTAFILMDNMDLIQVVREHLSKHKSTQEIMLMDVSNKAYHNWYLILTNDLIYDYKEIESQCNDKEFWCLLNSEFQYNLKISTMSTKSYRLSNSFILMLREKSSFVKPISLAVMFQSKNILHHVIQTSYFSKLVNSTDIGANNIFHLMVWVCVAKDIDDQEFVPLYQRVTKVLSIQTKRDLLLQENLLKVGYCGTYSKYTECVMM